VGELPNRPIAVKPGSVRGRKREKKTDLDNAQAQTTRLKSFFKKRRLHAFVSDFRKSEVNSSGRFDSILHYPCLRGTATREFFA
jgi:hypothetical protein